MEMDRWMGGWSDCVDVKVNQKTDGRRMNAQLDWWMEDLTNVQISQWKWLSPENAVGPPYRYG